MLKELERLINELDRGDKSRDTFDDMVLAEILWLAHSTHAFKKAKKEKTPNEFIQWIKDLYHSIINNKATKIDLKEPSSLTLKGTKKINSHGVPLSLNSSSATNKQKIRVPKKREYFVTNELVEALATLKQSHLSLEQSDEVDEEATVEYCAKTNILKPHFKSKDENYFDLYLMIDSSESMQIWQESIELFIEKLRIFSYFKSLKNVYLDSSDKEAVVYSNRTKTNRINFNPKSHDGRALLFVLSDCIAPAWREGEFLMSIFEHTQNISTVLINLLPKRMWGGTILGNTNFTTLHNPKKGLNHLSVESEIDDEYDDELLLKLPMVNFDTSDFKALSQLIMGERNNSCQGAVASKEEILYLSKEKKTNLTAQERVDNFLKNSSPLAQELALYLSITTHLNFEIMKMIQHNMLSHSKQIHLAEVFVGGLLNKEKKNKFYMFMVDENKISVRDILLERLGSYRAMATLQKNSEFIAQNLGSSLDFMALLHADFEESNWSEADRAFAEIASSVLNKIGGNYAEIASSIIDYMSDEEEEDDLPTLTLITPTSKRFIMGSEDGDTNEKPAHEVIINYDFEIAQTPVTVGEFRVFVDEENYITEAEKDDGAWVWNGKDYDEKKDASWKNPYFEQTDNNPVVCVSWNDAQAYIAWINKKTGESYRLPTEAEWEFSCRAESTTKWHFGDDESQLEEYAWYDDKDGKCTKKVATKKPNQWGLYDMHGNVLEWCLDDFEDNYNNTPLDGSEHILEKKEYKSLRGGSWNNSSSDSRSALRFGNDPSYGYVNVGFRLLRTLP